MLFVLLFMILILTCFIDVIYVDVGIANAKNIIVVVVLIYIVVVVRDM